MPAANGCLPSGPNQCVQREAGQRSRLRHLRRPSAGDPPPRRAAGRPSRKGRGDPPCMRCPSASSAPAFRRIRERISAKHPVAVQDARRQPAAQLLSSGRIVISVIWGTGLIHHSSTPPRRRSMLGTPARRAIGPAASGFPRRSLRGSTTWQAQCLRGSRIRTSRWSGSSLEPATRSS